MPKRAIQLDYSNALDTAVGAVHGLSRAEIQRAAAAVRKVVRQIERERRAGQHRYRDLPHDRQRLAAVQAAAQRQVGRFENLVVLGIGGSALGNIALQTALNSPYHNLMPGKLRRGPRLFVMDNVDPVQFSGLLDFLGPQLRKTLFNVISKSGQTPETAAQLLIIWQRLSSRLGKKGLRSQVLVTTDPQKGVLRELANKEGLDTLPVPPDVGGRFSVLSAVGLFSAAVCGIRIERLLAGAAAMERRVGLPAVRTNPAAMLALLLHAFYVRGKRLHVMMPYSYQLKDLADWYRQLWAESLAKARDLDGQPVVVGPTPIKALGATDQHSQIQLYREGPNDKVIIFLEVEKFDRDLSLPRLPGLPESLQYLQGKSLGQLLNAEKLATECALVASQRPCLTIRFPRVTEHTVGQFIMLWEAAVTIVAGLLNINPYDQPAVELGKQYTFALMGQAGYEEQARELVETQRRRTRYVV